jgi:hypothetical protein
VRRDATDQGEAHGKLLASLIISKIFTGMVSPGGGVGSGFVERLIEAVYSHFGIQRSVPTKDLTPYLTDLRRLSQNISERVAIETQLECTDLARVLRTSHHEILQKASESEDLREELVEEIVKELRVNRSVVLTPDTFRTLIGQVREVMQSRVYHRDDGAGFVTL